MERPSATRVFTIISRTLSGSCLSSHSQTSTTRHPNEFSSCRTERSLSRFRSILTSQNSLFVFELLRLHRKHPCQKHPLRKIATFQRVKTTSGFPRRSFQFLRYPINSCARRRLRNLTSGFVSRDRLDLMIFLTRSVGILALANTAIYTPSCANHEIYFIDPHAQNMKTMLPPPYVALDLATGLMLYIYRDLPR